MQASAELPSDHGPLALRRTVFAASILLAPLLLVPGTIFNPGIGGIGNGAANLAANAGASTITNQLHVATYVLETFLLPLSVIGLAGLALRRSPWLATGGGGRWLCAWGHW